MAGIAARLADLGIVLPRAPAPAANYVGWTVAGPLVHVAGQGPVENGEITCAGKVGVDVTVEDAQAAARVTALNVLAQLAQALDGDLDRVVRLFGLVNCAPDFTQQPQVINGASDLMVEVFGDAGRHARAAIGAPALPMNIAVEVDGVFEVR